MGSRQSVWLMMGGRLKPGVSPTQATAELSSIAADLERAYPDANRGKGLKALTATVVPGRIEVVAAFLGILLGIVGLVLMVACVNIAGMSLARAAARRREIAVRLAIGASRWRLIRQLLTETTVLFVAACAAGVLLSRWLVVVFLGLLPQLPVPVGIDIIVDWRVVAFAVIISLAAAVFSGLAPALQASRPDLVPALKVDALDGSGRLRLRSAFVVGQIAISLLLVIAAGLFIRALERAARIDPGFTQQNVDVITLDLSLSGFKTPEALAFVQRLTTRLRATPAVQSVSIATDLPLDGSRMGFGSLTAPGVQPPPSMQSFEADWNVVTPGFFHTLGVRLVSGRDFTDADVATAPGAIIVNEAMAKRVWGTTDVLGRRLEATDPDGAQHLTVVGVASDAQLISLGERVEPYVYVPLAQRYDPRVSILVKSTTGRMIPETRAILRALDPNLPVTTAMPLSDVTALELIPQRLAAAVAGSLGVLVLLLAAIGIYGVTSYAVTRRTREIGIRMALGAKRPAVIRLIVRQGVVLTATGVGLGLAAGAAGAQILRNLLFGVSALDPVAFGGATLLFTAVSLLASYLPARRASQVDPMQALRQE
jgi:predicted permease